MTRVGVITSAELSGFHEDEVPLIDALRARDMEPVAVVWTAPFVDDCDAYLMRTPWDWHLHADDFAAFLGRLPEARTWNRPSQMSSCLGKDYLLGLASEGVATVPTALVDGDGEEVSRVIAERGWKRAVVKPVVSASAARTVRVDGPVTLPRDRWLAQPYMPEIEAGELSFVFFDGVLSHVVRKTARAGDFRVQSEHGGSSSKEASDPLLATQATAALVALGGAPLYARVDGVVCEGRFTVMEIEVVEPQLFFGLVPEAGARLADALGKRMAS